MNTNQDNQIVVRALHSPHSFGRYEGQHELPDGSILQEETSKTEESGEKMDLENDEDNRDNREYRPFSPMGAAPMMPAATEEDVTYIVGKN